MGLIMKLLLTYLLTYAHQTLSVSDAREKVVEEWGGVSRFQAENGEIHKPPFFSFIR